MTRSKTTKVTPMTKPVLSTQHPLPTGYSTRPLTLDDAEAYAHLEIATLAAKGVVETADPDTVRSDWQSPDFDLATAGIGLLAPDGTLVGAATVWDTLQPPVQPRLSWMVHPDHADRGLEQYLIAWSENRAHQALDRCPPNARFTYRMVSKAGYTPRETILSAHGYEATRYWLRMVIEMHDAPPAPALPAGFHIRPYHHPDEFAAMVRALDEGFKDHWGHVDQPFEKLLADWEHGTATDKLFEPALHFVVVDETSGDIAGVCVCRAEEWGKPEAAYIDAVAVLRPYRRKGLAKAMLHHAFSVFWQRERKTVALYVDATSLTGATRVYEAVGMHADEKWTTWEKVIRDGDNLSTTNAE